MVKGIPRTVNKDNAQSTSHAWNMKAKRITGKRRRREGKKEANDNA